MFIECWSINASNGIGIQKAAFVVGNGDMQVDSVTAPDNRCITGHQMYDTMMFGSPFLRFTGGGMGLAPRVAFFITQCNETFI